MPASSCYRCQLSTTSCLDQYLPLTHQKQAPLSQRSENNPQLFPLHTHEGHHRPLDKAYYFSIH